MVFSPSLASAPSLEDMISGLSVGSPPSNTHEQGGNKMETQFNTVASHTSGNSKSNGENSSVAASSVTNVNAFDSEDEGSDVESRRGVRKDRKAKVMLKQCFCISITLGPWKQAE